MDLMKLYVEQLPPVPKYVICPECKGTGEDEAMYFDSFRCPFCHGKGVRRNYDLSIDPDEEDE